MSVEERYDFRQAGKSATIGCVILVVSVVLLCPLTIWVLMASLKVGRLYISFLPCSASILLIVLAVFGALKLLMGMWEQGEIEARVTHGLG